MGLAPGRNLSGHLDFRRTAARCESTILHTRRVISTLCSSFVR
jgi:hypothetical protein